MIPFKKTVLAVALLAGLAGASHAANVVIDFNSQVINSNLGSSTTIGGFTFALSSTAGLNVGQPWQIIELDPGPPGGPANRALGIYVNGDFPADSATVKISRDGGGTFDLISFVQGTSDYQAFSIASTGNADGGTVGGGLPFVLAENGTATMDTALLTDFQNIGEVTIDLNFDSISGYAFIDDLTFTTNSTVPEPDSLALVGAGLAAFGLAAGRNKRRRKAQA